MLRYLALGIALTCLMIGAQLYLRSPTTAATQEPASQSTAQTIAQRANVNQSSIDSPEADTESYSLSSSAANAPTTEITPTSSTETAAIEVWSEDVSTTTPPDRYTNRGIDARPLKIAKQQLAQASVGDKLKLPVPQTQQSYEMSIQQVGSHVNGDKTLKGHLTNQPDFAVVVTEGRNSTYATINTPDGSFMLEAKQEQGWLVAANDLEALVDPNLTDYQIPEINRSPN